MGLICRKCEQPADESHRDWGSEIVVFCYHHKQYGAPPLEHKYNVLICDAENFAREDRMREQA